MTNNAMSNAGAGPGAIVGGGADAGVMLVYTTFPDAAGAAETAEAVVAAGLAACANIIPGMTSVFIWEGRLEREQEVAMILKTTSARLEELIAETRRRHPYGNPAIVALPVAGGSGDFLAWIGQQTSGRSASGG